MSHAEALTSFPKKTLYKILMGCNMLDPKARRPKHCLSGKMRTFVIFDLWVDVPIREGRVIC